MPKKRQSKRKQTTRRRRQTGGAHIPPPYRMPPQIGGSWLSDAWDTVRGTGIISGALGMLPIPGASVIASAAGKMGGFGRGRGAGGPRVGASGMKM